MNVYQGGWDKKGAWRPKNKKAYGLRLLTVDLL